MGSVASLEIVPGTRVRHEGKSRVITHVLTLESVIAQDPATGKLEQLAVGDLEPDVLAPEITSPDISIELATVSGPDWDEARRRYDGIRSLLESRRRPKTAVKAAADRLGVHAATVYRWINLYESVGKLSALLPSKPSGGKGKSRLSDAVELILTQTVEEFYLNRQQRSIQATCEEVLVRCKRAKVKPPHPNTVRNRVAAIADKVRLERRSNRKVARDLFSARPGEFVEAQWPLSIVQIDHTKLDVIIVDERNRRPVGRPWITLAFDVYSRMVAGFYISLDPPGALSTGLCIAHAILPKETWLAKRGITNTWPCWGIPRQIHADNAKEFHGNMLRRACEEYGIELNFRPIKTPHFGGHIERMLGTLLQAVHGLAGTTFSNPKQRAEYNSDAMASMTLAELEAWLAEYVTGIYHRKLHSGIGTSPLHRYEQGILGSAECPGVGLPARLFDEDKLRLDFLPYVERTVQPYGVVIDDIHYYSDVLRPYINATLPNDRRRKRSFIFKRDPRDISVVYFFDPDLNQYSAIPYRDTSHPPMSLWELREARRKLEEDGRREIDERGLFEAYERLRAHEQRAARETRHVRRSRERRKNRPSHTVVARVDQEYPKASESITPFDELEEL